MIELDGVQYESRTPLENTQDLVDYVNNYCALHDIKNSRGDVVFIKTNMASPIYLLFWAVGYLASIIQRVLYSLGTLTSVSASSERQLLNLVELAGLRRQQATPTLIRAIVYADETGCNITTTDTITVTLEGEPILFSPLYAVSIAPNEHGTIVMAANVLGAFNITGSLITEFDSPPDGFGSMVAEDSIPGRNLETIQELRRRLQTRQDSNSGINKAMEAIRNLAGVSGCNIFYNYDNIVDIEVNGVIVPPRQAALYVLGYSPDVAKTYFTYLDRLTVSTSGSTEQTTPLLNGQTVSVHMIPPVIRDIYVLVYVGVELTEDIIAAIKRDIASLSLDLDIARPVNSVEIIDKINDIYKPLGVYVSFSASSGYTYNLEPGPNEICRIMLANITIEEVI